MIRSNRLSTYRALGLAMALLAALVPGVAWALASERPTNLESQFIAAPTDGVEGEYIGLLHDNPELKAYFLNDDKGRVQSQATELSAIYPGDVERVWGALNGFSVKMTEEQARRLAEHPQVRLVEQNRLIPLPAPVNMSCASSLEGRVAAPSTKACPHRMPAEVREALLEIRRRHPRWGPRKLLGYLRPRKPEWTLPAASTVGDLLRREGLVQPRRRRSKRSASKPPIAEAAEPNDVWTTDFKGEFRTRDQRYCYPLTLSDRCSRYLLDSRGLRSPATEGARPAMERAFLPPLSRAPGRDGHFEVRRVHRDGQIKWRGEALFLTSVLAGERVGLEEVDDGIWAVHFGTMELARFDERERRIEP